MSDTATEPKINLPDSTDKWESTIVGDRIVFVKIEHDDSPENPLKAGDSEGTIHSYGQRHDNFNIDKANDAIENNPDAVPLSYFEHSACKWFVKGSPTPPGVEFQFDGVELAGVWVPNEGALDNVKGILEDLKHEWHDGKAPDRRNILNRYAAAVCEEYTQWCNGDVFGYTVEAYSLVLDAGDDAFEDNDDYGRKDLRVEDSCWGYYGVQEAANAAEEAAKNALLQE